MNLSTEPVALAGATGDLGGRIARELLRLGVPLRVLARPSSDNGALEALEVAGAEVYIQSFDDQSALTEACNGVHCVVSALSGLEDVIVDTQLRLLAAARAAGVRRFVPSDFSIDFTTLPRGTNRNLDLRRKFHDQAAGGETQLTSVLNGMFADLLTGEAPFIIDPLHRVIYYGNARQPMDFTTMDDTARYTARVAADADPTPRYLRIAGDVLDTYGLAEAAGKARAGQYRPLRVGGLGLLSRIIDVTHLLAPGKGDTYPAWQGMQYMRNMFSGAAKLSPLDNDRYPDMTWTPVAEVLRGA